MAFANPPRRMAFRRLFAVLAMAAWVAECGAGIPVPKGRGMPERFEWAWPRRAATPIF